MIIEASVKQIEIHLIQCNNNINIPDDNTIANNTIVTKELEKLA